MAESEKNTAKFVLLMATGTPISIAAKKARIPVRTAHRLMNDDSILSEIWQCRRKCLDEAVGKLAAVASDAAFELAELIKHKDPQVKLRAIKLTYDSYLKISERESLEQRLQVLEEASNDNS